MASTLKHLRSSTADKRPTASGLVDGQLAINTASGTPALFFKDNNGGVVKVGPAHVGSTAPNAVPAGSAGNSLGELWVDNGLTTPGLNYYTGSAFVNLTPSGTTTTVGLVELATPAETQTGTDAVRAVTPSGLQSKVSDSTSTTSSTTIASSTAVKSAYDLANAALPKAGGTVTGELLIGNTGSLVFEGSSDDSFETTIAVVDPTGDRTITFPNVTGTVVTTGDSGTVTSTMIANDTIVNADINSAAAIAYSKLALSSGIVNTDISASAAIVDTKLATISTADKVNISALDIDGATDIGGALEGGDLFVVDDGAGGTNRKAPAFRMSQLVYSGVTGDITIASGGTSAIGAGVIVNADVNASAAIAGTKISPDFGSQTITTTGVVSAALGAAATPSITFTGDLNTGIYSPGADQVAISTNGTGRLFVDASGNVIVGATSTPSSKFCVVTSAASVLDLYRTATGEARLNFFNNNASSTATQAARISGLLTTATAGAEEGALLFSTTTSGASSEKLRITSAGLVGIGTTGPVAPLNVHTASSNTTFAITRGTVGSEYGYMMAGSDGSTTPALRFFPVSNGVQGSEVARITSAGLVGIGTTSPGSYATGFNDLVVGNHTGNHGITIASQNNSTGRLLFADGTGGTEVDVGEILYNHANNSLSISTNRSTAATIDSSGRLLVGTSTSYNVGSTVGATVQAVATSSVLTGSFTRYTNDNDGAIISLGKSRGTSAGSFTVVQSGDIIGNIRFAGADGGDLETQAASIRCEVDGTPGANEMPGRLVFSTATDATPSVMTERMRIDSAGNVGIGRAPTYALDVYRASGVTIVACDSDSLANGEASALIALGGARQSELGVYKHAGITNPCSYIVLRAEDNAVNHFWVDNSDQFRISTTVTHIGTTSGTVVGTQTSDERLKNILGPVEYGLDTLKQIEPVRYALKTEPDTEKLGFIAQQVLPFIPQSVFDTGEVIEEGEPTKLGMEYVALIPVLVNAIKELSAEVDALKAQLQ